MYKVLSEFADLQDGNHIYSVGDVYPHKGYSPTDERVDELSTGKNLLHKPLIQKVIEIHKVEEQPEEEPEAVIEEEPKRKRGKKTDA